MKVDAKRYRKDFYAAQFIQNISKVRNSHRREHCSANRNQINKIGISQGQQVRIIRPLAKGNSTLAVYTVSDIHDQKRNTVYLGYKDPKDLQARLELLNMDPFKGKVEAQVTKNLAEAEAEAKSEFIERLIDDGHNSKLIVIAPHGGNIEIHTDEQAERVCEQLPDRYVSAWMCKGFKQEGGAYDRWHITSTDISEKVISEA
jgi:poly-gamma-glutamate hydrolase-like protein